MNIYEPYQRWNNKHNSKFSKNIETNTQHINSGKVAVFLVFQPNGLVPSTWLTLKHLKSKGYSTLLVSNCQLTSDDQAQALPMCWKVIVRPNFGYDFGGYQVGVLIAMRSGQPINQMLILNDSIWFPLHHNCDFLERVEARKNGFVGAFQLEPTRDPQKMQGKKRPFMGSFFWHFKQPVLNSSAFTEFWENYKSTSSKYATIRRGERRFTHYLLDAGLGVEAIYSRHQFDCWLELATENELFKMLNELCTSDPDLDAQRMALLAKHREGIGWEIECKILAQAITASQNIMATAPLYMVRELRLPFLKKSRNDDNLLALNKLNEYFTEHPGLVEECVLSELQAVLQRQAPRLNLCDKKSPEGPAASNPIMPNEK